jgi:hypothetical protein
MLNINSLLSEIKVTARLQNRNYIIRSNPDQKMIQFQRFHPHIWHYKQPKRYFIG